MSDNPTLKIYDMEKIDCLIIGGGPAGYTAAIYASRANIAPVLYEGSQPGGQLTTTTDIENYPGFENGISGQQLVDSMKAQAVRLGTDMRTGTLSSADLSVRPFKIVIDGTHEIEAKALIIATGATATYLGLPSEEKYRGLPKGCWRCKYLSECRRPKEEGWKCYNGCRIIKENNLTMSQTNL